MRDPFMHARLAGASAVAVTLDYFSAEECAKRILPVVALIALDQEETVRQQAFRVMRSIIEKLEENSNTMVEV